jgi:hypothetical protein
MATVTPINTTASLLSETAPLAFIMILVPLELDLDRNNPEQQAEPAR